MFWFPLFNRYVVWYQEEEEYEYYNEVSKRVRPPKKKRKKDYDSNSSSSEEEEEEEPTIEYSLETINEFSIPPQFRPEVEVGFRKDDEEFDFDMKYTHVKMAAILTAIGSEQYSPDIWNDYLTVSICDSRNKILASTQLTVAALCVCIRFDNIEEFYEKLFDSEKSKTSRLAISTMHNIDQPQLYLDYMDDTAVVKSGTFDWICRAYKNCWLPNQSWDTLHGEFSEIRLRAILSNDGQELSIERHSIYTEMP